MTTKEQTATKCDTCGVAWGLYRHPGGHRCAACLWGRFAKLQAAVRGLRAEVDKKLLAITRTACDALASGDTDQDGLMGRGEAYNHALDLIDALLKDHCAEACEVLEKKGTENAS